MLYKAAYSQTPESTIDNAFKSGNATTISKYFAPAVDITINNSTSTYSKAQAELVLKDFFNKNPVRNFEKELAGNSSSIPSTFTIGNLSTSNGDFKVYIWLKPNDKNYVLKALRIEK